MIDQNSAASSVMPPNMRPVRDVPSRTVRIFLRVLVCLLVVLGAFTMTSGLRQQQMAEKADQQMKIQDMVAEYLAGKYTGVQTLEFISFQDGSWLGKGCGFGLLMNGRRGYINIGGSPGDTLNVSEDNSSMDSTSVKDLEAANQGWYEGDSTSGIRRRMSPASNGEILKATHSTAITYYVEL
jgi:hypothetical protein